MAERGLYMTTEIVPRLKSHGIELSREQIYRIATHTPQRLSLELLGALCEILECAPNDLIQFKKISQHREAVGQNPDTPSLTDISPIRAKIARPNYDDEE